jgi:hypothetical protein
MKNIIITIFLLVTGHCFSQDTITTPKAKEFMDKEVCVVGKVVSIKLASEGKYTNYINLDKPYPESVFTVVITNNYLEKLKINLEELNSKTIIVKGTITTYKNDPKQIPQIYNPISIVIK